MKTLDYHLNAKKNRGDVIAFSYSQSLNELVGSWSAEVAEGSFKAGDNISFEHVMTNGIITKAYKNREGLWYLEGKDAGINLMKSLPKVSDIPDVKKAKDLLAYLAGVCGMSLDMPDTGLEGFEVKSILSGSTCAEAILELALVSGMIAYIDENGRLVVKSPVNSLSSYSLNFSDILDDSASDIDLDGYATHVLVTLNYREKEEDEDEGAEQTIYIGDEPPRTTSHSTVSGTFPNGSYSITTLEPFGVISEYQTVISQDGVTITTKEKHNYNHLCKNVWRDNQEFVLWAFIECEYELERTVEGDYTTASNESIHFKEVTTETMNRTLSASDARLGVPEDWEGDIKLVGKEVITRSTERTGGKTLQANMPDYSPPFDSKVTREYSQQNFGKILTCDEVEEYYEARQVGSIAPVKINGQPVPHFLQGSNLAIQTHSTPQWVLIKKRSAYLERYNDDGECIFSTQSEYSDDGAEWLVNNALKEPDDPNDAEDREAYEYEQAYAKFSQTSQGLKIALGSSVLSSAWQYLEVKGRIKTTVSKQDKENTALANVDYWYDNGQYIKQTTCPHYNSDTKSCDIAALDENNPSRTGCMYSKGTGYWRFCDRALEALELARKLDKSQVNAPVIGSAHRGGSEAVGYQRDIYIDTELEKEAAQNIANTIAQNILAVKSSKGFRKTITIPYNTNYSLDGRIVAISHDWANLQTTITYREDGDIPECLISQSMAGIAGFVAKREDARHNNSKYGVVKEVKEGKDKIKDVTVTVDQVDMSCSTKLDNLTQGDIVIVIFPAGNKIRGQVIARL